MFLFRSLGLFSNVLVSSSFLFLFSILWALFSSPGLFSSLLLSSSPVEDPLFSPKLF